MDVPAEAEGLIKEVRRRQHRRWLAAGAAILIVCTGAARVIGVSGAGRNPWPPGRSGGVTVNPAPSALSGLQMAADGGVRLLLDTAARPGSRWRHAKLSQLRACRGIGWIMCSPE
jgi:hypothetical protein